MGDVWPNRSAGTEVRKNVEVVKELRVGCAMWSHREWLGRSIPRPTSAGQELAAYASILNAVEGNTTFYALP